MKVGDVVQFRFEPNTGGTIKRMSQSEAVVTTRKGDRKVPLNALQLVRPEHVERVWRTLPKSKAGKAPRGWKQTTAHEASSKRSRVAREEDQTKAMIGRVVKGYGIPGTATVVQWEPLGAGMTDVLLRYQDGREVWHGSSDLKPADGLGPLSSRQTARTIAGVEAERILQAIRAQHIKDFGKPWPGVEFGKVLIGRSIDAAVGDVRSRRGSEEARKHRLPPDTRRGSLDAFTQSYIETALWSSTDNSDDSGGDPLDKNYDISDIDEATLDKMVADCADFQEKYGTLIDGESPPTGHIGVRASNREQAGHDFWLTRNGHGAGFWDGDWPEYGDALTKASKTYGEYNLYVGDDGSIYGS